MRAFPRFALQPLDQIHIVRPSLPYHGRCLTVESYDPTPRSPPLTLFYWINPHKFQVVCAETVLQGKANASEIPVQPHLNPYLYPHLYSPLNSYLYHGFASASRCGLSPTTSPGRGMGGGRRRQGRMPPPKISAVRGHRWAYRRPLRCHREA